MPLANWKSWITAAGAVLLSALAVWTSFHPGVISLGRFGLSLLGIGAAGWLMPGARRNLFWRWAVLAGWGLSLFVPASLLLPLENSATPEMRLDRYLAVLSWSMAATLVPALCAARAEPAAARWRFAALVWALLAAAIWLGTAYVFNLSAAFFAASAALAVLLVLAQVLYRPPEWIIHSANTLILLLAGLLLLDTFVRSPRMPDTDLAPEKQFYSYEVARRDPAGFARWWKVFGARLEALGRQLYVKDPAHKVRFRLRPNAQTNLFQSTIRINSRGFRGPEFSDRKGAAFRIVCLGESTTFGCTLNASDRPWPELLEDKIRSRLDLGRPVEVINAGTPSFTLEDNLARLEPDILPLKPGMLISYHGYNGFPLLHDSFPVTAVSAPPAYIERPIRLLALAEFNARLFLFKRQLTARLKSEPPTVPDPLDTSAARAYERLIRFSQTNNIRLALATHALAVNQASPPGVIEFYRTVFPTVHWLIGANRLHSELIERLCAIHPETRLIDVSKDLDGRHAQFIDLVHLTQEGREQLAESVFQSIKADLEAALPPEPRERAPERGLNTGH